MSWPRLAWRLQRFEIASLALAALAWIVTAGVITWRLYGYVELYPDCFGLTTRSAPYCEEASLQFAPWDQTGEALLWFVLAIPIVFGVVLGSSIVAREIEEGTVQLAWAYSRSRTGWLGRRLLPVALALLVLLTAVAVAAEVLTVARLGGENPGFQRFDQRGVLVVLRGLVAFAVGLLLGTWLGRTLPTVLAATAISAILVFGLVFGLDAWRRSEAVIVEMNSAAADEILPLAMILDPVAVLADGTVITDRSADLPPGEAFDALTVLPGSAYWAWIAREAAALLLMVAGILAATTVAVRHRRPM